MDTSPAQLFDAHYYATGCGSPYHRNEQWLAAFGRIADRIIGDIQPKTVLDAGCALGFLVESLRTRGVEAYGVDISEYAIQNVVGDIRPFCRQGSVTDPFPQRYDLIVSIEVLEHMPPKDGEAAIANLCQYTDDILFSSTPFDYKEATHFNVQVPDYWAEQFARHGFYRDVDFDASFITQWAMRLRRRQEPIHRLVRDYERRFWILAKETQDLRALALESRDQLADKERRIQALEESLRQQEESLRQQEESLRQQSAQVGEKDRTIATLNQALGDLHAWRAHLESSPGGAVLRSLQNARSFVAPPQSLREQWLERTLGRLRGKH